MTTPIPGIEKTKSGRYDELLDELVAPPPLRIVIMGVSGVGKTTVGERLAQRLGVQFVDADSLHSAAAIAKMSTGTPLTDRDREPWLERVGAVLAGSTTGVAVACSALKRSYRNAIRMHAPGTLFICLSASRAVIARRHAERAGHFMPPVLLNSQLDTLEPLMSDELGAVLDSDMPVQAIVDQAVAAVAASLGRLA
jgi:carbohydrate kinase (thermoresistant glucokinase family)